MTHPYPPPPEPPAPPGPVPPAPAEQDDQAHDIEPGRFYLAPPYFDGRTSRERRQLILITHLDEHGKPRGFPVGHADEAAEFAPGDLTPPA